MAPTWQSIHSLLLAVLLRPTYEQGVKIKQAAARGDVAQVLRLLQKDSPLDGSAALIDAAQNGHASVVSAILEHSVSAEPVGDEVPPLIVAAANGHLAVARLLLEHGASVDATDPEGGNASSLLLAAERGDTALVHELLEYRAAVDAADTSGLTPLLAASRIGQGQIVSSLCAAGASTALRRTKLSGYREALASIQRRLPDLGCIKAAQHGALTPLFLAAVGGHGDAVEALLKQSPAKAGDPCVLALAKWMGNAEVVALMLDHLTAQSISSSDAPNCTPHALGAQMQGDVDTFGSGLCAKLSKEDAFKRAGVDTAFLPASAVVQECVPQNHTHGGVLVITDFLTPKEAEAFGELSRVMIDGRVRQSHQSVDNEYVSTQIFWPNRAHNFSFENSRSQLLNTIGSRLRGCPGVSPPLSNGAMLQRPTISYEKLQVAAYHSRQKKLASDQTYFAPESEQTDQRMPVFSMHHDRNRALGRFATVILYIGSERHDAADGGHTVFPFLTSGVTSGPAEQARQALFSLVSADMRSNPLSSMAWQSPPAQAAIQTLCEEVRQAAMRGQTPPCIAVAPIPGTAAIFFNWARRNGDGGLSRAGSSSEWAAAAAALLEPEWSNIHFGCPSYRVPKLMVQSFREMPASSAVDITKLPAFL